MKGINEQKKAELDTLAAQVLDAQHELDQCEATVAALTEKLNLSQNLLAEGESNTTQAQNNKTLIDAVVQSALDLQNNSSIAYKEIAAADSKTKDLAAAIKILMDKLIYSAEMINKLASIVTRKKALNPLISDELVSMINTAGSDANNAVALTLVALQSTFSATASNIMSEGALALENTQAITLYQMLTAKTEENKTASSLQLYIRAYDTAKINYTQADNACKALIKQLNDANRILDSAQVKLNSLQSGLAAANAAALAS